MLLFIIASIAVLVLAIMGRLTWIQALIAFAVIVVAWFVIGYITSGSTRL